MDSWEFNKIAGAVLAALLVAFGSGTLIQIATSEHGEAKPGYVLPVDTAAVAGGGSAPAAAAFDAKAIVAAVAKGSAENGQAVYKPCATCHTATKGGKAGTGPNLWGIVGRSIAANSEFPRYSAALKGKGGEWTYEALASWLHDPKGYLPGNQMAYAGVKNNADLADLLAYLRTLADTPVAPPG